MRLSHFLALSSFTLIASASQTHEIIVAGSAGNVFTPNHITASNGDYIKFQFHTGDHSATEGYYTHPCTKKSGGADSGTFHVHDTSNFPTWTYHYTTNDPVYFHSSTSGECEHGMVFAINTGSWYQYLDNADPALGTAGSAPDRR